MDPRAATPDFWHARWQRGEIGFHQPDVHELLVKHWPVLNLRTGSEVLVPLCGKSRDMLWLASQGHTVTGVELSPIAVDDFFKENGLTPEARTEGPFTVKQAGPISIWCGDIFALPAAAMDRVAAVYDRASLVAFPGPIQSRYARKLTDTLPSDAPILLVSLAYPPDEMEGPPFSTSLSQVASLFGATHSIALAEARDGLEASPNLKERGLSALEEAVYILRRR